MSIERHFLLWITIISILSRRPTEMTDVVSATVPRSERSLPTRRQASWSDQSQKKHTVKQPEAWVIRNKLEYSVPYNSQL